MENTASVQKVLHPTITVAVIALFIEAVSLSAYGRSPAYSNLGQVINDLTPNVGYLAIISTLTFAVVLVPLIIVTMTLNAAAYKILAWPFRKVRGLRTHNRFLRRRYIDSDLVLDYARYHKLDDLSSKVNANLQKLGKSPAQPFLPLLVIILTIYILLNSSQSHPNFLMKVCSLQAPVRTCPSYTVVILLVYFQAFLLMALNHQLFRNQRWFPKSELPVPVDEVLSFGRRTHRDQYTEARAKWMRGRSSPAQSPEGVLPNAKHESSSETPVP